MKLTKTFIIGFVIFFCWAGSLYADYTIVLKNRGRITVQSYQEEGGIIKFYGLGGEIGIPRQQIQSILRAGEGEPQGMVIAVIEKSRRAAEPKGKVLTPERKLGKVAALAKVGALEKVRRFGGRDKEAEDYQGMYKENTRAIRPRTELHWLITRGKSDPDPTLLEALEALNGRIDDLNSRIKDVKYSLRAAARSWPRRTARANGTRVVNLITNSMFAGRKTIIGLRHEGVVISGRVNVQRVRARRLAGPLPGYTNSERELSELRNQLNQLYEERKKLTQLMKRKGTFTGSLPYEAFP